MFGTQHIWKLKFMRPHGKEKYQSMDYAIIGIKVDDLPKKWKRSLDERHT